MTSFHEVEKRKEIYIIKRRENQEKKGSIEKEILRQREKLKASFTVHEGSQALCKVVHYLREEEKPRAQGSQLECPLKGSTAPTLQDLRNSHVLHQVPATGLPEVPWVALGAGGLVAGEHRAKPNAPRAEPSRALAAT